MFFRFTKELKWTLIVSLCVVLYIALSFILFSKPWFQGFIVDVLSNSEYQALFIFSLLCILSSMGLPRQIVAFTCGYFFDVLTATLFATCIVTIAAIITYQLSSMFKQRPIVKAMRPKIEKVITFLSKDTFYKSIIIRLLPVGSNFLTNIFAGMTQIPFIPFIIGSAIGYIPQMFIFSLAGSGIKLAANEQLLISVILLAIATILGGLLYKKTTLYQTKKKSD